MKAIAVWVRGYESQLEDGRGHTVVTDLPSDEDGGNLGTSSLELAVLSLAGCISTIFALVARRRRLRFEAMRVELEAERPRGAPTISAVHGTVHLVSPASADEVETAVQITLRTCPVGVLFERAKIPVEIRTALVNPLQPQAPPVSWHRHPPPEEGLPAPAQVPIGVVPGMPLIRTERRPDGAEARHASLGSRP